MKISEWLNENPVLLDQVRKQHNLHIDKKAFEILVSKLKKHHFDYFKSSLGLHLRIDFIGYTIPVKAIVPYKDKPVDFYKWWCDNIDRVDMKS